MSILENRVDVLEDGDSRQMLPTQGDVKRAEASPTSTRFKCTKPVLVRFLVFAVASALMYGIFFSFTDQLFPLLTAGTAAGAALVISLALAFSLMYGTCANYLLELLGLRELK